MVPVCCRSLGVHISKVRSIQLDAWEPELLKVSSPKWCTGSVADPEWSIPVSATTF